MHEKRKISGGTQSVTEKKKKSRDRLRQCYGQMQLRTAFQKFPLNFLCIPVLSAHSVKVHSYFFTSYMMHFLSYGELSYFSKDILLWDNF